MVRGAISPIQPGYKALRSAGRIFTHGPRNTPGEMPPCRSLPKTAFANEVKLHPELYAVYRVAASWR